MSNAQKKPPTSSDINKALSGIAHKHETLPLSKIRTWSDNPRRYIEPEKARELGESVITRGQIHNIVVRPTSDGLFEAIVGNRRVTGLMMMRDEGKATDEYSVNVTIVDVDDQTAMLIAMAENISRESMNPIETCEALSKIAVDTPDLRTIARSVGLKTADVSDMIAVAHLEPEIKELIGTKKRKLEWGKAMVRAGSSLRTEIMNAIEKSEGAYVSVQQVNSLMRQASVPAKNALFDPKEAGVVVQEDLLEADQGMISDKEKFWEAQNKAIQDLVTKLEEEGHIRVDVLRGGETFKAWDFETSETADQAIAVVEVANDGHVTVHPHLVKKATGGQRIAAEEASTDESALFNQDAEALNEASTVSITERPPSNRAAEFLAHMRTAVATNLVANDLQLAMAIAVAGMMGELSVGIDWPAQPNAMDEYVQILSQQSELAGDDRLTYLMTVEPQVLNALYAVSVAIRLRHQVGRKPAFVEESIVSRVLAEKKRTGYKIRETWLPDEEFFDTLTVQELRILTSELLQADEIGSDVSHTSKVDLVKLLHQSFADSKAGTGNLAAMTQIRLNEWVPQYVF